MPIPMPGVVSREGYFDRLDRMLNAHPRPMLEALKSADPAKTTYRVASEVVAQLGMQPDETKPDDGARDAEAICRADNYWYGESLRYFEHDPFIPGEVCRQITRLAYLRALDEAIKSGSKIRTVYCCTGDCFEAPVVSLREDKVVLVLLITGNIKPEFQGKKLPFPMGRREDVWVSTTRERIELGISETNDSSMPVSAKDSIDQLIAGDYDVAYPSPDSPAGILRPRTTDEVIPLCPPEAEATQQSSQ